MPITEVQNHGHCDHGSSLDGYSSNSGTAEIQLISLMYCIWPHYLKNKELTYLLTYLEHAEEINISNSL